MNNRTAWNTLQAMESAERAVRVLIVDTHPLFLRSATRYLVDIAHLEIVACVESFQDLSPEVHSDLILIDWQVAADGQFGSMAHRAGACSGSVFLLAQDDYPEYHRVAQQMGADGYLPRAEFASRIWPVIQLLKGRERLA